MSANTCPFPSGLYTITALTGPVGGGPCGDRIVVKDQSTFFIMQNYSGPGNCTYAIYVGLPKYHDLSDDGSGNLIYVPGTSTIPHEWVVTPFGDQYTVVRKGTNEAWTDPEGPLSCEHQLHLTPLTGVPTDQQKFTFVRTGDQDSL